MGHFCTARSAPVGLTHHPAQTDLRADAEKRNLLGSLPPFEYVWPHFCARHCVCFMVPAYGAFRVDESWCDPRRPPFLVYEDKDCDPGCGHLRSALLMVVRTA